MYDAEKQMQEIMKAPQITAAEKSKLYSDELNSFLTFKGKIEDHHLPFKTTPISASVPSTSDEHAEKPPPVRATHKPNFLNSSCNSGGTIKAQAYFFPQLGRFFGLATKRYSNDDCRTTGGWRSCSDLSKHKLVTLKTAIYVLR